MEIDQSANDLLGKGEKPYSWGISNKHVIMTKYDGRREHYDEWNMRTREFLSTCNPKWLDLLDWVEKQRCRLLLPVLDSISPKGIPLRTISEELWKVLRLCGINVTLLDKHGTT